MNQQTFNFYDAFHFLEDHPVFDDKFQYGCLTTQVVKVNPLTETIEDDDALNTAVRVWLECGPVDKDEEFFIHDYDLDCGAPTYEEAIIKLASLVKEKYGDYEIEEPTEEEMATARAFFDRLAKSSSQE